MSQTTPRASRGERHCWCTDWFILDVLEFMLALSCQETVHVLACLRLLVMIRVGYGRTKRMNFSTFLASNDNEERPTGSVWKLKVT